jgi:hypothetical protein
MYGSANGVAALCKRWTNSGVFDNTSNPTLATVNEWLEQVSSMIDIALSTSGFTAPVTSASITPALNSFVNAMVTDLAGAANSSGRFYSDRMIDNGVSPLKVISKDIFGWIDVMSSGILALGAGQVISNAGRIAFRDGDDDGNQIDPLFGRDTFGKWSVNR